MIRYTTLVGVGIAALVSAAASSSEAQAADVVIEKTNPWGCYVGIVGGYGFGGADIGAKLADEGAPGNLIPEDGKADLGGGMVGGLVGCDYGLGNGLILGLAGDLSWSGINGDADLDSSLQNGVSNYSVDTEINWLGTARAKVGFELGDAVIYGTGGFAFAGIDTELRLDGMGTIDSDSGTKYGWTLGGGMSYMATEHLMLGVEYLYVDLGDESYDFGSSGDANADINMHIIRGSIGYRF